MIPSDRSRVVQYRHQRSAVKPVTGRRGRVRDIEDGRRDVDPTYHRFAPSSARTFRRSDDERQMNALVVQTRLRTRKRPPVIGEEDDHRILCVPRILELRENQPDTPIQSTDRLVILSEVCADSRQVREMRRNHDLRGIVSDPRYVGPFTCIAKVLLRPMRISESDGDEERLAASPPDEPP